MLTIRCNCNNLYVNVYLKGLQKHDLQVHVKSIDFAKHTTHRSTQTWCVCLLCGHFWNIQETFPFTCKTLRVSLNSTSGLHIKVTIAGTTNKSVNYKKREYHKARLIVHFININQYVYSSTWELFSQLYCISIGGL